MNIQEKIINSAILSQHFIQRDGFIFSSLLYPANIYDAIVIHNPPFATSYTPRYPSSSQSLEAHIALIDKLKLQKAIVIAEDIDFLRMCPSLQFLSVIPADSAPNNFDFSVLYDLPQILSLHCSTEYGVMGKLHSSVDYSRVTGLVDLGVSTQGDLNFNHITTLKSLSVSHNTSKFLTDLFCSQNLDTLQLMQCRLHSLDGLEKAKKMQRLNLYYNRNLVDISALFSARNSLFQLCIENCPHITDFSVLDSLSKLEYLELKGSNTLPSLKFLRSMPNLKVFHLAMNVADGDLSLCMKIPYATCKNKKHFTFKDADLPKNLSLPRDDHGIEQWRR